MKKITKMLIIAFMILSVSVYGNGSPEVQCQDVTVEAGVGCEAYASIDDGSSDPDGDSFGDPFDIRQEPPGPYPLGETIVTLIVTDESGNEATCQGTVTVEDTTSPVAQCQNVTVLAGEDGTADASIDDGSYDDACPVTLVQDPPGPYPLGETIVTLRVTDEYGNVATCQGTVTVEAPVAIDIKPESCPNPLNVESKGVFPVAIAGTNDFDVTDIDIASVRLEGVAPDRSAIEDVTNEFYPPDCFEDGFDGLDDLTLKFERFEIVSYRHQVCLRRQLVSGASPVRIGEWPELTRLDETRQPCLRVAKVTR